MTLQKKRLPRNHSISKRNGILAQLETSGINLAIIALFTISLETHAQNLPWSSIGALTWSDFQGTPPPLSPNPNENYDAFVYNEILWDFTWDLGTRTLGVNAQAVFVHAACWYRPAAATPTLLTHESGHFDYAEIHARQFKQTISDSVELKELLRRCDVTEAEIEALLTQYHSEEIDKLNSINEFYDSETNHGQILSMQNAFTNVTIPGQLDSLNAYADPNISVTVENEGAQPTPGDYEGTLEYTIQTGTSSPFKAWNLTLQGQWNFSFSANETSGVSSWSHQLLNSSVGGHLLTATTPVVPSYSNIPVNVQSDPSGSHYWMDFSAASADTIPSHELTFAPVSDLPISLPVTPGNTTIPFSNSAAIALGNFMREQGTTALQMKTPITCPNESIYYLFDMGAGQFLELNWTLTRISDAQGGDSAGGSGGSGIGITTLPITAIETDIDTGTVTISWDSLESGLSHTIEASEDLVTWTEIGSVLSTSAGITSFIDDGAPSLLSMRFYRVQPGI
jgi:hypothetical protein